MLDKLLNYLYSFYFNVKLFGIKKGSHIPILINHKTRVVLDPTSKILIKSKIHRGMISLGIGGSINIAPNLKSYLILGPNSILSFSGNAFIGEGFSIRTNNNSNLELGANFWANRNLEVNATNEIKIGDNVLIGWNVMLQDGAGHRIRYVNSIKGIQRQKKIYLDNNIWLASHVYIMGGSNIKSNSVVALDSLVNKEFPENSLIGGVPAHKIKDIKGWER